MRKTNWILASAALLFSISLVIADSGVKAATASAGQTAAAENEGSNPDQLHTYAGVIVSMNGARYILRDDENDTWYHLDDQQAAGKFLGKKVLVSGQLDATTDMIHVRGIEEAKA
jgi:Protein of unknown function (DUF5818)